MMFTPKNTVILLFWIVIIFVVNADTYCDQTGEVDYCVYCGDNGAYIQDTCCEWVVYGDYTLCRYRYFYLTLILQLYNKN